MDFYKEQAKHLETINRSTRQLTFSKTFASKIVGSRYRLENLVSSGHIAAEKKSKTQNGKWYCSASDVLKYARKK